MSLIRELAALAPGLVLHNQMDMINMASRSQDADMEPDTHTGDPREN